MNITVLGYAIVSLTVVAAFARPAWLLTLLAVAAVLQGGAVLVLDAPNYGLQPYWLVAAAVIMMATIAFLRDGKHNFAGLWREWPLRLIAGYTLVAVTGAFLLPFVFDGLPVFLLMGRHGFNAGTTPLSFTLSNIAHAMFLSGNFLLVATLCWAGQHRPEWKRYLLAGLLSAGILVVLINFYVRLSYILHWPDITQYLINNPGYVEYRGIKISRVWRIAAPFSEASYASAFCAAMSMGCFAVAAFGLRVRMALVGGSFALACLVSTLGSTGWAAWISSGALLFTTLLVLALRARPGSRDLRRRLVIACLGLAVVIACLWVAWGLHLFPVRFERVVDRLLVSKLESNSAHWRYESNMHAMWVVRRTVGFGVGLGSDRASSYFASLLSNVGLPGMVLFVGMIATLAWCYLRASVLTDAQIFVITALVTATIAVGLAIPDLNWPTYWIFILTAFAYRPCTRVIGGEPK